MQQLRQLGLDRGFTLEVTGDTSVVTAADLAKYRAVAFLNTTGDYLTDAQQAAFEAYFGAGGGFVGIGSAVELEPGWAFLTDVLGSRSTAKLDAQTVTNKVADRVHDASKDLPEYWNLNDTYYNWTSNVRGVSHVLTTVVDAPFAKPGTARRSTRSRRHDGCRPPRHLVQGLQGRPLVLHQPRRHGDAAWSNANLVKELVGALVWASGQCRPRLQRLRRDRARELLAGQDQRPAERQRADRLRPAPGRTGDPDRPSRRRAAAQPGDRHDAGLPTLRPSVPSQSTPTARTACTAPGSTPTSRRTSGSTSTTPRRSSRTSPTPTGRRDTRTTSRQLRS